MHFPKKIFILLYHNVYATSTYSMLLDQNGEHQHPLKKQNTNLPHPDFHKPKFVLKLLIFCDLAKSWKSDWIMMSYTQIAGIIVEYWLNTQVLRGIWIISFRELSYTVRCGTICLWYLQSWDKMPITAQWIYIASFIYAVSSPKFD